MQPPCRGRSFLGAVWIIFVAVACRGPEPHPRGGFLRVPETADGSGLHDYRGLIHLHSEHSHDSEGTLDDVLAAAHAAGADFVWVTDHNNRDAEPWQGMQGDVLLLVGEERSQPEGHLLVFGDGIELPLGATTGELLQLAEEGGGFCAAAHPDRESRPWEDGGAFDDRLTHVEVFSAGTLFKERKAGMTWRLPWLAFDQVGALRSMMRRPDRALAEWDRRLALRPVTGLASVDLHFRWYIPAEAVARLASTHVFASSLEPAAVVEAMRAGRAYMAFECFGDATGFDFHVDTPEGRLEMGESVLHRERLWLHTSVPARARVDLYRDGERWQSRTMEGPLEVPVPGPGVYRAEVYRDDELWVLSNAIRILPHQ